MPLRTHLAELRRFALVRLHDATGVSGTGVVASGVQFPSGLAVMQWAPPRQGVVFQPEGVAALLEIHGHGNGTIVHWIDPAPTESPPDGRHPL
jgi:hypothetical protein